ncbi:hypothetical protein [Streptomyces lasiicapitis]|uniref:Uncharacterized protein n=1 Tax=Streptomyces lasiicapitis TaxID=1923961 RepID=A0ABQ2MV67_9ACTN|nr:hypothetical protein [Streptomyces lasiicapitis]GGO58935.1 hypothetical protein GCM10012286_79380 [Streptomyces lasiicapitis]
MARKIFGFVGDDFAPAPDGSEPIILSDGQSMVDENGDIYQTHPSHQTDTDED